MATPPVEYPESTTGGWLRRATREPMLHFLALAGLIFILYAAMSPPAAPPDDAIIVTAQDVQSLKAKFRGTWGRDPSAVELREDIDRFIRTEVFYREAKAMGLDQDDQVVRARMGQKIEFLLADPAALPAPSEADLRAFYAAKAQNYAVPGRVSFLQVFLGNPAPGAAEQALDLLRKGKDPAGIGTASLLPAAMSEAQPAAVDSAFGTGFFQRLLTETAADWAGPVPSSYGQHLVKITSLTASQVPAFEAVRGAVETDWRRDATRKAEAAAFERLKARYRIDLSATGLSE